MPETYFPCQQNENHTLPLIVQNFFIDNYIQDGDNFILGNFDNYSPGTDNVKYYYFCRWKTVDVYGRIQADGYTFYMDKAATSDARFLNGIIQYTISPADVRVTMANAVNMIYSPLPLVSSKEDSRISFISNINFYSDNDELLILYPYGDEPESKDFTINNIWAHGTWSATGLSNVGTQNFRLVRGKMLQGAKIAFYPQPGVVDGKLKYNVLTSGSFDGLQYSVDGVTWQDSSSFPFDFFYKERTDETGTFDFGLTFYASIPVFSDKTKANKYVTGDPSVTEKDAENWPQISGEYPASNTTGTALPASTFGDVKLKGFFSQQYICDSTCLAAIATDLFDTSEGGIWEYIKKGLDMYGNAAPIEAVMGLSFWPFNVSDFIGSGNYTAANYIWFGGYGWDTTGHGTCNHIIYASGYKDLGTIRIVPTFNNWRDFEPYTKLYVSIPYCGTYQLDLARYMGKDVRVRYFIDTRTNGCMCALIADNYLMDYFNGQMGVTMPITLTDYSAYMNAQMQVLLQGGGQAVQSGMNAYGNASGFGAMGGMAGLAGGLIAGGTPAAISGAVTGAKTVFGLAQNNINKFNVTKGCSSSMINCYLPQTVDFIFEIQEDCAPANYREMLGSPSMVSGRIYNFTGYLKCQSVKLECNIATERERERLKQMLLSGIYI